MRLRRASLLLIAALACGCRTPAHQPAPEIPVERSWSGKGITAEEKEALVALARAAVPGRGVEHISLIHFWDHPDDRRVAIVEFETVKLDAERYESLSLTVFNRNWHHLDDENPPDAVFPPETCWHLDEGSRQTTIRHGFSYRGRPLLLSIPEENTHQEIEEVLRMFEQGKAVDEHGNTEEFLSDRTYAIRKYEKNGSVFVEVTSADGGLTSGTCVFEIESDTLVLKRRLWRGS